jgi:hypothetical protein
MSKWQDNIKMDFTGMLWEYVDWIDLAYDRDKLRAVVNTGMNFRVP